MSAFLASVALLGISAPAEAAPTLDRDVIVSGLNHPWDMAFLSDGTMFFTERSGEISVRLPGGTVNLLQTPNDVLDQGGEGGMLGLAVDPDLAANPGTTSHRYIYTCFSSNLDGNDAGPTDNRLVRWRVNESLTDLTDRKNIVTGMPHNSGLEGQHSGCRPRFRPGTDQLFVGTGDAIGGTNPQSRSSLGGKVLRIKRNGKPYPGNESATNAFDDRIFNHGHRNVQGIAFDPLKNEKPYSMEHGTFRDDELNKAKNGRNYGWDPGPNGYNGSAPMTDLAKFPNAVEPLWSSGNPTIAPSGITFLSGSQWEDWNGAVVAAVLKDTELRVFFFNGDRTKIVDDVGVDPVDGGHARLRSVVLGPDRNLYVATDGGGSSGEIWRVTPS